MKKLNPKAGLLIFFIAMLVSMFLMNRNKVCFSEDLPYGFHAFSDIIAFELVKDSVLLENMLTGPCEPASNGNITTPSRQDRIGYLLALTWWDFLFILSYSGFLFFLSLLLAPTRFSIFRRLSFWMISLIAIFDVGENIFSLLLLSGENPVFKQQYIDWMYKFSFSKWMVLFILVLYLGNFAFRKPAWLQKAFVLTYGAQILLFLFIPIKELGIGTNATEIAYLSGIAFIIIMFPKALFAPLNKK